MENFLSQLERFYKRTPDKLKELLISYANDWGYPIYDSKGNLRLDNLKNNLSLKFPEESDKEVKNRSRVYNYWKMVITFHFIYNVPLEAFRLGNSKTKLAKRIKKNSQTEFNIIRIRDLYKDGKKKRSAYLNQLFKFISKVEKNLFVYDYLERQYFTRENTTPENDHSKLYESLHRTLYQQIERRLFFELRNHTKEYTRILVLPSGNKHANTDDPRILTESIIKYCSPVLFEHLCKCIDKKREYSDIKITFFMLSRPTRPYEYAISDGGAYSMTELYRYTKTQELKPELLIIDDNKGKYKEVSRLYKEEINELRKSSPIFNLTKCEPILNAILQDYQERFKATQLNLLSIQKSEPDEIKEANFQAEIDLISLKIEQTKKKLSIFKKYFD